MARQRHKPQRTCVACREIREKRELIRVVRTPVGEVIIDPTGKANGRGAYVCRDSKCWDDGLQKGRLAQALDVTLAKEEITALRAFLQAQLAKA